MVYSRRRKARKGVPKNKFVVSQTANHVVATLTRVANRSAPAFAAADASSPNCERLEYFPNTRKKCETVRAHRLYTAKTNANNTCSCITAGATATKTTAAVAPVAANTAATPANTFDRAPVDVGSSTAVAISACDLLRHNIRNDADSGLVANGASAPVAASARDLLQHNFRNDADSAPIAEGAHGIYFPADNNLGVDVDVAAACALGAGCC